jgi:energy-coupling factor transport system ATP-binding protein
VIRLEQLAVSFGAQRALGPLDLDVADGGALLVTGPTGCGKSTLARCLNGLIPQIVPARLEGRIELGGCPVRGRSVAELGREIGLVFQNPATQLCTMTVEEELAFGPANLGLPAREVNQRRERALRALDLEHLRKRALRRLSGGEQQRVAIAAVLSMQPRVLVLDEPTASLDVPGTRRLVALLEALRRDEGTTLVVVEHRLGDVARVAERTLVLGEGRPLTEGPTLEVLSRSDLWTGLGLRRPATTPVEDWAHLLGPRSAGAGPALLTLRGIAAGYGHSTVIRDVDLTLHEGELVALVGDNGAGKSTLAKLLSGFLRPSRGSIHWHGRPPRGRDVGILLQEPLQQVFCDTVRDDVWFGPRNLGLAAEGVLEAIAAHDLDDLLDRRVHRLSRGQQLRSALAAVAACGPRLLILDEPTLGQDWRHLERSMEHLRRLSALGCAVLLISHDYKLVHRYAQRVLLMQDGRLVADGSPAASPRSAVPAPGHAHAHA